MKIVATEFDFSKTQVVYEANGVKVTSFPVVHCIGGAVGYRLDFAGLSFGFSGDARPCWPLVRACEGVDLLIHECFPPAAALAAASGLSIERATIALNAAHTSPKAAGKVLQPREAASGRPLAHAAFAAGGFDALRRSWARCTMARSSRPRT